MVFPSVSDDENESCPTEFQRRVLWKAVTGLSMAVIGTLAVLAILLVGRVLSFLQPVLVPVAVAAILAYLFEPVVVRLRKSTFLGRPISRTAAVAVVFGMATLLFLVAGLTILPTAINKLGRFVDNRDYYLEQAQEWTERNLMGVEKVLGLSRTRSSESSKTDSTPPPKSGDKEADTGIPEEDDPPEGNETGPRENGPEKTTSGSDPPGEDSGASPPAESGESLEESTLFRYAMDRLRSEETMDSILSFLNRAFQGFLGTIGYVVGFFLVPVYLFFFLNETELLRERWTDWIPLRESRLRDEVISVFREINGYLVAFFRGQVIVSFIDGALTGIALAIMGLDGALVIGIFLAILGVIPFVGIVLTMIPAVLIAIAQFGTLHDPLIVVGIFIAVQQIDALFVQPKVVGNAVGLHPMTVIFSVFFWSLIIGGLLGALMAVPLTAAIKVIFQRYIWEPRIHPGGPDPNPEPEAASG